MAISFEAIAERYVTFLAGNTAAEGKLCKVTANGTVGACAGGDEFCGVITQVRNGAASVLMGGFMKLPYTGAAPALGFTALALFVILFVEAIFAYDKNKEKAIRYEDVMKSLFAGILMPAFLSSLVILRECGRAHVLYTIGLTFITDAGAYFAGVLFGRHKGITQVSPHKSLEGYIGGLVIGMVFSLVYGLVLHMGWQMEVHYLALAIYGLVGALVTEIGDLSFSLIKRECGIKDYGKLLPGHGGMMDRFDSMVFCAPVIMLFYYCFPGF